MIKCNVKPSTFFLKQTFFCCITFQTFDKLFQLFVGSFVHRVDCHLWSRSAFFTGWNLARLVTRPSSHYRLEFQTKKVVFERRLLLQQFSKGVGRSFSQYLLRNNLNVAFNLIERNSCVKNSTQITRCNCKYLLRIFCYQSFSEKKKSNHFLCHMPLFCSITTLTLSLLQTLDSQTLSFLVIDSIYLTCQSYNRQSLSLP